MPFGRGRRWLWRYSKKRTRGAVGVWDSHGDVDLSVQDHREARVALGARGPHDQTRLVGRGEAQSQRTVGIALDASDVLVRVTGRDLGAWDRVARQASRCVGRGRVAVDHAGHDDGHHRGGRGDRDTDHPRRTTAAGLSHAAPDRLQSLVRPCVHHLVGVLLQHGAKLVGPHRSPPPRVSSSAGSIRSLAMALLVWLLTVPTEHSSSRAVSASVRSSK